MKGICISLLVFLAGCQATQKARVSVDFKPTTRDVTIGVTLEVP